MSAVEYIQIFECFKNSHYSVKMCRCDIFLFIQLNLKFSIYIISKQHI